jgi:hypothetical protein
VVWLKKKKSFSQQSLCQNSSNLILYSCSFFFFSGNLILAWLAVVLVKPQSHCHVSTATFCYVLKCYVSCQFLMVCTFRYVYTTLFYVFLRTVTFCHGLLEMQILRSATLHYVLLRMYYVLLRFATYWYGSVRFNYVPLRLRYVLIRLCYVLVRPTT